MANILALFNTRFCNLLILKQTQIVILFVTR